MTLGLHIMKDQPLIIVSACLVGLNCRYNAEARSNSLVLDLVRAGKALPVCPEQLGGLPTPRDPAEMIAGKVVTVTGKDVTENYLSGATQAAKLAKLAGCEKAYLKSLSPSCGLGRIYDGTFTRTTTEGDGVFAAMLKDMGIQVECFDFGD